MAEAGGFLSEGEMWQRVQRGDARVVVGARSAIFAPVEDLGVVVVDEEHDPSFKQEEGFRYHGRDMALLRAHLAGATCVLVRGNHTNSACVLTSCTCVLTSCRCW